MKSFVATMCVFMLGIVSFGTAMAGVVEESGNTDPDTFYDSLDESGDEIYLENGGTTLVFDKVTGNLTYWSDASGAVLADTPSGESKSAADTATDSPEPLLLDAGTNRSECDIWGGQEVEEQPILIDVINWNGDCNPFALYLYNGTNGWGGPLDYITDPPEVFHPMAYGTTYSSSWNGSWLHHTWSVYFMLENHGHHLGAEFDKPLGNVPALIETNDENYPLFTVEAEVLVQLDGTVRWRNIEVVWDNGGEEYQPALERFGVYGVQYPIIRGFDTGHAYAPGANQDYLVAPIKDGLLLNNPLYNIWNPVPDGHKGTDFENMEPRRWGDQIELKEKEDSPGIINTWVRNYPDGYHLTMPFLAYYTTDTGRGAGTYFVIPDTTMKAKSFIVRARDNTGDEAPDRFDFSFVHWSDDVCDRYLPDDDPREFGADGRKVCQWGLKDFGPPAYEVRAEPLTERNWYQPVERYRDWARANAPWWGTPNKDRPLSSFYKYAGIAVRGLSSKQDVANPSQNFVAAYHNLLKQSTPNSSASDDARVLFIQGWDWLDEDTLIPDPYSSFFLAGGKPAGSTTNNLEYWNARFGPVGDPTRTRDAIMRDADAGAPYYDPNKAGDYLVPYLDSLSLCYDSSGTFLNTCDNMLWDGYERQSTPYVNNPGAPWQDRRIFPDAGLSYQEVGKVRMNTALAEVRSFLADRDHRIVADPFRVAPDTQRFKPLSGFYHDVGVTVNVALSFRSHPERESNPHIPAYLPSYGGVGPRFQVGRGGFTNIAARDMFSGIRTGSGYPAHLMATERMTEIFVDLQDFYSAGENADGPIKRFDIAGFGGAIPCDGAFTYERKWVMEGSGQEIPLLQYAYHSAMPVRTTQMTLSGGADKLDHVSANNIGDIFYWLAARQYLLYGGIAWLAYESTTIDLLSFADSGGVVPLPTSLDPSAHTYELDWAHDGEPEAPAAPLGSPPHDWGRYDWNDLTHRNYISYGDPAKEKFLRLLAFLRLYRLTKFVANGDLRRPGTYTFSPNPAYVPFDYEYYFARAQSTADCRGPLLRCNKDECLEHSSAANGGLGAFPGERFIHVSWKDAAPPPGQKPEIIYVMANLNSATVNVNYSVNISAEYGATTGYACMLTFNPNTDTHPMWSGTAPWTVNGTRTFTNVSIPAKNVTVIKIKPTSACSP